MLTFGAVRNLASLLPQPNDWEFAVIRFGIASDLFGYLAALRSFGSIQNCRKLCDHVYFGEESGFHNFSLGATLTSAKCSGEGNIPDLHYVCCHYIIESVKSETHSVFIQGLCEVLSRISIDITLETCRYAFSIRTQD
jgi:hypothetical protein